MNCIRCGTKFDAASGRCPKCAWNPEETHGPLAGFLKGEVVNDRYTVRESLGKGRLGVVVKAIDLQSSRAVALKFIHPALIPNEEAGNYFLAGMERLKREQALGCAQVLDAGRAGRNRYYFARELLYGVTVTQLMEDQQICGQTFPLDEAVLLVQKLARALSSIRGIAHGAFSPSKIWVLTDHIKIIDHGLVGCLPYPAVWHILRRSKKANWYLAPELQDNQPPDSQSDVYSLAVLLGEMLSLAEYNGRVEIFRESEPDFPVEVEALLRCALSLDPDARYFDSQEFVTALFDVTGHQRTMTMPPDNTAVVPSKFLNTLRSMSEAPPSLQRDTQEDLAAPVNMDITDPLDDFPDPDTDAEITRQVPVKDVLGEVEEEDVFDNLSEPSSPLKNPRPQPTRSVPPPLPSRSSVPSVPYPSSASADRPAPLKPASMPPTHPASARQGPPKGAPPMPMPSRPAPPMPGRSTPKAPEAYELSSMPPVPTSPPLPNPTPAYPSSFRPTDLSALGRAAQTAPPGGVALSAPPPITAPLAPVPSVKPPVPSVRPPMPSAQSPAPHASPAPPTLSKSNPGPKQPPRTISALELEGINPRFLRAAAKIEESKIRGEAERRQTFADEEEWRKQLEESSSGSVISFLPPATAESPNEVQGFPKNQQKVPKPRIPSKSGGAKPPPIPTRRK